MSTIRISLGLLLLLTFSQLSGQKLVKTYYGLAYHSQVREEYTVDDVGRKSGKYKLWSSDGKLIAEINYKEDVEDGKCQYYIIDDCKHCISNVKFKMDGDDIYTAYWPNGKPTKILTFKKGVEIGRIEYAYDEKGDSIFLKLKRNVNSDGSKNE
jgi:antitoxin component YwqK of YwqJK toxin-antitoxin module